MKPVKKEGFTDNDCAIGSAQSALRIIK